jgi:hypothetical protein
MNSERAGVLTVRDEKGNAGSKPGATHDRPATMRVQQPGQGSQNHPGQGSGASRTTFSTAASSAQDRATLVNITPQQWIVHRTYGTYIVPGCVPGQIYAMLELGPRTGRIDLGDKREFEFPITAREIAEDIAREINSDAGEESDFGVFACKSARPSEDELSFARTRLETFYKRQVVQADQEWERTKNSATISDVARRAARALKLEREWFYEPQRLAECPACGERIRPGVAVCRTCGAVLDKEKAARFGLAAQEKAQQQMQTAARG